MTYLIYYYNNYNCIILSYRRKSLCFRPYAYVADLEKIKQVKHKLKHVEIKEPGGRRSRYDSPNPTRKPKVAFNRQMSTESSYLPSPPPSSPGDRRAPDVPSQTPIPPPRRKREKKQAPDPTDQQIQAIMNDCDEGKYNICMI